MYIVCMSDINEFKTVMKNWISVDNQIKAATQSLKALRSERAQLTQTVCKTIQTNHWETRKIEAADSQISFTMKKEYPALTFTFLEKHLAEIIPDPDNIKLIVSHLKNKREPKSVPDLKRVYNDGGYETE
jgi:hypothetical protein